MPRYRLTLEYDGGPFVGFQSQANGPSVQDALESALRRFCGAELRVYCAGRTDAGVHALGQVAHFDLDTPRDTDEIQGALNFHLRPAPIAVLDVAQTSSAFHARFDATARHYQYRIVNRRAPLTVDRGLAWHVATPLDAPAMQKATRVLIGKHDFTTFRSAQCQARSPIKTLDRLDVERQADEVIVKAQARSFLHHQVRSIVGCLKLVGEGKWSEDDLRSALDARRRTALGLNAPPDGLYLVRVLYEEKKPRSTAS